MDGIDRAIAKARVQQRLPAPAVRRQLRETVGLTQQDVADALGVTRACVAYWEMGRRTPRRENAGRYLALLNRLATEATQGRAVP